MGLVLKYVVRTPAGAFQYRRRVPKEVATVIQKREFKQFLGDTERAALSAWSRYHGAVEREIADAKRLLAQPATTGSPTEREAYEQASKLLADLTRAGTPDHLMELTADNILDSYAGDPETGEPLGVSDFDGYAVNLLRHGRERVPPPQATLEDAKRLYIAEHMKVGGEEGDSRAIGRVTRVVGMAIEALGRNPVVSSLTRNDARTIRDHMLDRIKSNGEKISPASVIRELNDIKAVVSYAKREMGLPGDFLNPFNELPVARSGPLTSEAEKRLPLPPKVLKEVRTRVLAHSSAELALIWRLLEGTGCRLAEVAGLRVEDIVVSGPVGGQFPHVRVTWHEDRRVKTLASLRHVPLVGDALEAAKAALDLKRDGHMVFPSYGRSRGPDSASAALMKHLRRVTDNPKHVVHSLRHNMKDNLNMAEVSSLNQNLILGHSLGSVGDRVYGGGVAKLRTTARALKIAMGVPLLDADTPSMPDDADE